MVPAVLAGNAHLILFHKTGSSLTFFSPDFLSTKQIKAVISTSFNTGMNMQHRIITWADDGLGAHNHYLHQM